MAQMKDKLTERRRYIRLRAPIGMTYTMPGGNMIYTATAKDISADGLRFQTTDANLKTDARIEVKLNIEGVANPIHAKGKVVWKKRLSLEDTAPFDVGLELTEIEDDNKNTFLKFLCDLLYSFPKERKEEDDEEKT